MRGRRRTARRLLRRTGGPDGTSNGPFAALVLIGLLLFGTVTPSVAATLAPASAIRASGRAAESIERHKVLATIESRTSDERTLERMREKLGALSGRRLRLAAALCDRMARDEGSAGADVAFSLVTALIVLS